MPRASVVQWIGHKIPDLAMLVRFLPGAQFVENRVIQYTSDTLTSNMFVMNRYLIAASLLGVGLFTSGCSLLDKAAQKATEKATEAIIESESGADVDLSDDGFTVTDEDSGDTLSFGEDVELPDDFPADVPIIDNSTIIAASSTLSRGEHTATLTVKGFSATENFYQEALVDEGWTIDDTSTLTIGTKITTITASKADRTLTVGLYQSDEDEVSVILTVTTDN